MGQFCLENGLHVFRKLTEMRRVLLLFLPILFIACENEPEAPASGSYELIGNWAPERLSRRDIWVWTPPNYDTAQSYPVLFMHDGQMLFDTSGTWNQTEWRVDETMNRLISQGAIRPAIVVGIGNGGKYRRTDYLPTKPLNDLPSEYRDSLIDNELMGRSRADDYVKFICFDLKPYIQKNYAASEKHSDYFLMGSSMGGLISLYTATEFPEHFGGAACLSTHWPGGGSLSDTTIAHAMFEYFATHMPNPYAFKLYCDYGTQGLDAAYGPYQAVMDSIASRQAYTEASYMSRKFEGADHNENSWAERLEIPLTFLLGRSDEQ